MVTPSSKPLVSIITVVRNGAETIAETLYSVRMQRQVEIEHLIIDGGSSDRTLDIIKAYQHDQLRWISESDDGIYDAMNKGISLAKGEWLLFLGADDALADPDVLKDIFGYPELLQYDLVCGRSNYRNGRECIPKLDWHTLIFNTVHHQAAFYRRHLFDAFRYRLDIPVVADYEMNFLIYREHRPVLFLERKVSVSGIHGISHNCSPVSAQLDAYRIRGRHTSLLSNSFFLLIGLINIVVARLLGTPRTAD